MLKLSVIEKFKVVNLREENNRTYRSIANQMGIAKSTLHDNINKIKSSIEQWSAAALIDPVKALVRVVLIQALLGKSSSRDVALTISAIWHTEISHQTVLSILDQASVIATKLNLKTDLSKIKSAVLDEIFQKRTPLLVTADPLSGVIYAKNCLDRTGESWAEFLGMLQKLGLNPETITTDGGQGILKGVSMVFSSAVMVRDLFHVLQKLSKAERKMEGKCFQLLAAKDSLIKQGKTAEVDAKNLKFDEAATLFDTFEKLHKEFRKSAFISDPEDKFLYIDADSLEKTIYKIVECLESFQTDISDHRAINDAKTYLKNGVPEITAYKRLIERKIENLFGKINKHTALSFLCPLIEYINQYLRSHDSKAKKAFWGGEIAALRTHLRKWKIIDQNEIDNAINMTWEIGCTVTKSDSYIEAVNSVIRVYLQTYKSIPGWFPGLFTYYWNNKSSERGKRAGHSPLELLNGKNSDRGWLDQIMEQFPVEKFRSELPLIPGGLQAA